MRKNDVELVINTINNIKDFTNKLDFNTSKYINQQVIKIMPILKDEYDRLDKTTIDVNSPKLLVYNSSNVDEAVDYINQKMAELVRDNFRIIDFGFYDNDVVGETSVYIKYTD